MRHVIAAVGAALAFTAAPAHGDVGELRAAASGTSLAEVLAAVDGGRPGAHPTALPPGPAAGVPASVRSLLAVVLDADRRVAGAVAPADRARVAATVRALTSGELRAISTGSDGTPRMHPRIAATAPLVDVAAMRAAAADIAVAVDRLLATPPPAARGNRTATACDVAEVPGILCVGGAGANEHRDHYRLVVDLGGNDLYTGPTAAGGCLSDPPAGSSCVAVTVDLGGHDRYVPAGTLPACEAMGFGPRSGVCGHGSGIVGVGMLVDAAGDDVYEAHTRVKADDCLGVQFGICGVVTAQATGRFGVGVLADLQGDDRYALLTPMPDSELGDRSVSVAGQGTGVIGTGVLWDGDGDDSYVVEGAATGFLRDGRDMTGWSTYETQGVAVGGAGVILEAGGADAFRMRFAPGPGAAARTVKDRYGEGAAISGTRGQGFGLGAGGAPTIGAIVTGTGDTTYELSVRARFYAEASGQGAGTSGVLDDAGGDDSYELSVIGDGELVAPAVLASALADPLLVLNLGFVSASGQAHDGARLVDRGGDDTYSLVGEARLAATATEGAAALERVGLLRVSGQASGARLLDLDGDDNYTLSAHEALTASGPAGARASARSISVNGQGSGGTLADRGGRDGYATHVTADVLPTHAADAGDHEVLVQGFGGPGLLDDTDEGEPDTFHADTAELFSTCNGTHGTAPGWGGGQRRILGATGEESCSSTGGAAVVTSSAPAPPRAGLALAARPAAGGRLPFTVTLTGSDGAPLAHRRVLVRPELLLGAPYYVVGPYFAWQPWDTGLQVVTDATGTATGSVLPPTCPQRPTPCDPPRLSASFFGDEAAGPVSATASVQADTR